MLKVMLVEDEAPVRSMMMEIIDWESLGFQVVYGANDGKDALEYLEEHAVDLIISDIYMPFVDGIELIRRVRKQDIYTKVVYLTGYNEFDYAKEAIDLNVSKYLLKPITKDEVTKVLVEMGKEISEEIERKKNVERLEVEFEKYQEMYKTNTLYNMYIGEIPGTRVEDMCKQLEIIIPKGGYQVAVVEIVDKEEITSKQWGRDIAIFNFALQNICKEVVDNDVDVFIGNEGSIVLGFLAVEQQDVYETIKKLMRSICHVYRMELTAGVGSVVSEFQRISQSYKEAKRALEYQVIEGTNKILMYSDLDVSKVFNVDLVKGYMENIEIAIRTNDKNSLSKYLQLFFEHLKFQQMKVEEFRTLTLTLVTRIYATFLETIKQNEEFLTLEHEIIKQIMDANKSEDLQYIIEDMCDSFRLKMEEQRLNQKEVLVYEAKKIMEKEFQRFDLDMEDISQRLHVSSSYLSRLFSQYTEGTFIEYLTNCRMEKAKELLRTTSLKVFEISEQVGYEDSHYFSYNFRKNIGKTPRQFRKENE